MKDPDPSNKKKTDKILVIGSDVKIKGVVSFEWKNIPKDLNFADFNKVIINLYSIYLDNKKIYNFNLNEFSNNLTGLIWNKNAEIIAIGRPLELTKNDYYVDCYSWLPNKIIVKEVEGDTFSDVKKEFEWYFKLIEKWPFYFEEKSRENKDYKVILMYPLAKSINDKPLGVIIKHKKLRKEDESAFIILLPPTTKIPVSDSIRLIIEKRYDFEISSEEPAWVEKYKLPSQKDMEEKIKIMEEDIKKQIIQRDNLLDQLKKLKDKNKLLYEKGFSLQESVLECISLLGAKLEDVPDKTKEDGRFVDPQGRKYMIEIKGSNGQMQRKDIRELDDWIDHATKTEGWKGKGLLIGNYLCDKKITDRKDIISPNEEKALKRFEFCFLKTTQLFKALESLEKKNFDQKNFWNKIHKSTGSVDLPDIEN